MQDGSVRPGERAPSLPRPSKKPPRPAPGQLRPPSSCGLPPNRAPRLMGRHDYTCNMLLMFVTSVGDFVARTLAGSCSRLQAQRSEITGVLSGEDVV
jgi:hypothetical protein